MAGYRAKFYFTFYFT